MHRLKFEAYPGSLHNKIFSLVFGWLTFAYKQIWAIALEQDVDNAGKWLNYEGGN